MNHCQKILASLLWRSPSSLAFAIGCGAFAISESFSNPVALWVYQNGDRYLILPSPPVFPSFILHPLDIPMFFVSSSPARNHLPPGANVPGASAELLTRAQNGAEARYNLWEFRVPMAWEMGFLSPPWLSIGDCILRKIRISKLQSEKS